MSDPKPSPIPAEPDQPTPAPAPDPADAHPVDAGVQEEAAEERAENGGYT